MTEYILSVIVFMLSCAATTVAVMGLMGTPLGMIPISVLVGLTGSILVGVKNESNAMEAAWRNRDSQDDDYSDYYPSDYYGE